jgi:sugar phosphate isomerase/epimerase
MRGKLPAAADKNERSKSLFGSSYVRNKQAGESRKGQIMQVATRRKFLGAGVATTGYLAWGGSWLKANPLGMPSGFQIYGVREQASKDLAGTLKQVAALGYERVELCSFPGYVNSGFGALANMQPSEVRKAIEDAGMRSESCHFQFRQYEDASIGESVAYAKGLNLKYMIMSSPREGAQNPKVTMDDWKWNFDHMNKVGEHVKAAGMQFGYHNHGNEWKTIDGVLVYDELLKNVDAKLVQLQMDLGGTVSSGHDPVKYLERHPGRFCSLHVKDAKSGAVGAGSLELGKGDVNWNRLFAAAKKSGTKSYYVEMEVRPRSDPMKALQDCATYLHQLSV